MGTSQDFDWHFEFLLKSKPAMDFKICNCIICKDFSDGTTYLEYLKTLIANQSLNHSRINEVYTIW